MLNALYVLGMILMILFMFTLMVVSHEWGHYITAKKCGVLVHEFAVGMGPILWSKQKGETLYSVRLLPIGGFCRMEEETGESTNPKAMASKRPWQKLIIVVAGAFMNFVLAWVLLSFVAGYIGVSTNVIDEVQKASPAAEAGLMAGDQIISIDGHKVTRLSDLTGRLDNKNEKTYTLEVKRHGEKLTLEVQTKVLEKDTAPRFGFIVKRSHYHLIENIKLGFLSMVELIKMVWESFVGLITGAIGMDQMAGIVGVVDAGSQVWSSGMASGGVMGAIINMVYMTALLSANLGVVNLLPLPALDGGRVLFILVEMIRGKAIPAEKEGAVHFIGMVLLMLLTIIVMYNDIMRLIR